jgi:hypothetical protein
MRISLKAINSELERRGRGMRISVSDHQKTCFSGPPAGEGDIIRGRRRNSSLRSSISNGWCLELRFSPDRVGPFEGYRSPFGGTLSESADEAGSDPERLGRQERLLEVIYPLPPSEYLGRGACGTRAIRGWDWARFSTCGLTWLRKSGPYRNDGPNPSAHSFPKLVSVHK